MFPKSLIHTATVISAVCFLAGISGCKNPIVKDTSLVNGENDLLNMASTDTFTVFSKTEAEAPYKASGTNIGVLGSMNDPIFGKTACGFYAQYRMSSDGYKFGENAILDSCVLSLVYDSKYGANTQPINIAAYEITETLDNTATYNTHSVFSVNGNPLGVAYGVVPNYTDSVVLPEGRFAPQLRIRLNSIGQRILAADSATLAGNTNFLNFFKGVYITPQGTYGNGVSYINLLSSKITVYYHNNTNDSLLFNIPISSSSATVNHYEHQYSNTIQQTLNSTLASDSVIYLQSGAGIRVKLTIPSLDSLPEDIAINKAELIVTKWDDASGNDTFYSATSFILIQKINASGNAEYLNTDYENAGLAMSQSKAIGGKTYTQYIFPLSIYTQQLVKKQIPNKGLYLTIAGTSSATRGILANFPNSDKNCKITLRITYTKLI